MAEILDACGDTIGSAGFSKSAHWIIRWAVAREESVHSIDRRCRIRLDLGWNCEPSCCNYDLPMRACLFCERRGNATFRRPDLGAWGGETVKTPQMVILLAVVGCAAFAVPSGGSLDLLEEQEHGQTDSD